MNRAQRRARERALKKAGKKGSDMEQKLGLFDKIPENCLTCNKPFDKKDKEMATTWNVVVRKEDKENPVRLYCPTCWDTAQEVINSFLKNMEEEK